MRDEKYHQSIVNSVQEPILVIDREFRVVDANEAARLAYGNGGAVIGRACFEATHRTSVPCQIASVCPVRSVFASGRKIQVLHEHRHADGKTVWEEVLASPLLSESGHVELVVEEMRDLTEVLKNRKLVEELQAEVKTLRGLVPICSHCKRIRDSNGTWENCEEYISRHTNADFSHSICPACLKLHYSMDGEEPEAGAQP